MAERSDEPTFFVDRSLGRHLVPEALRAAGCRLHTLAEIYGVPADETVEDVTWLERAGREGWPVLMKDDRIRYRDVERTALVEHGVRAFCLTAGNLRAADMAAVFLDAMPAIRAVCGDPGPSLHAVSARGLRRVDL